MWMRGSGCIACVLVVLAGVVSIATVGCSTHQCDPSAVTIGKGTPLGVWRVVGNCENGAPDCELVWASSETIGSWLPFAGNLSYTMVFPPLPPLPAGLAPDFSSALPEAWVASSPPDGPDDVDANFTSAAGQLVEFQGISAASVELLNATCERYAVLVRVTVPVVVVADAASDSD